MTLLRKFFTLLGIEKRDIFYIYVYAFFMGLISLSLPLLIQTVINLVSAAQVTTSIVVLTALIIITVVFNGGLQVMQLILVEFLQRRIFAKTALALSFKIPRIRWESVFNNYPPELINRFFDVVSLQKGLSKLLTDFSVAIFQVFFGIILLAIYHPLFLVYALALAGVATGYFKLTSPIGLKTSIDESRAKYAVAHWLEELGRALKTFKLAGISDHAMNKADGLIVNYLNLRDKHFKILKQQYWGIIIFKMVLISGLLILGSILVINQQINYGQFVAAEILIILILSAVEKALANLDTIYDLLTSFEKVNSLTEIEEEEENNTMVRVSEFDEWRIDLKNLSYAYPGSSVPTLQNFNASIKSNSSVVFTCESGWSITTLLNIIMGILEDYTGQVLINGIPLLDIDKDDLRKNTGDNLYHEEILHGTVIENIILGRKGIPQKQLYEAMTLSGLDRQLQNMQNGLNTQLVSGGINISADLAKSIILTRAIIDQPKILILNADTMTTSYKRNKEILSKILAKKEVWTVLYFSQHDELIELADDEIHMPRHMFKGSSQDKQEVLS